MVFVGFASFFVNYSRLKSRASLQALRRLVSAEQTRRTTVMRERFTASYADSMPFGHVLHRLSENESRSMLYIVQSFADLPRGFQETPRYRNKVYGL